MRVPSYSFHVLLLKLPNKGICFQFPSLKLPNKGMKEYSKMILFIPFHSIPFPPPKRSLSCNIFSLFYFNRFILFYFIYLIYTHTLSNSVVAVKVSLFNLNVVAFKGVIFPNVVAPP